jgi:hypothetical protein
VEGEKKQFLLPTQEMGVKTKMVFIPIVSSFLSWGIHIMKSDSSNPNHYTMYLGGMVKHGYLGPIPQGNRHKHYPLLNMPFILSVPLLIQGALQLVDLSKRRADAGSLLKSPCFCNIQKEGTG